MKIFVTGGTGFVGTHWMACAAARGHDVVALCRPESRPAAVASVARARWVAGDLESIPEDAWDGIECVVHLAAAGVSPRTVGWSEAIRWNVAGTARVLSAASQRGIRRFLIGGTCHEFGRTGERYERIPAEATPLPVGVYATSKAMASSLAAAMARDLGLELTIARVFHCFGAGQHSSSFWPALRAAALAGNDFAMTRGEQIYDFSPIDEIAMKLCELVENSRASVGVPAHVNVGSGESVRLAEFAQKWWRHFEARGELQLGAKPYRPGELMRLVPALEDARGASHSAP